MTSIAVWFIVWNRYMARRGRKRSQDGARNSGTDGTADASPCASVAVATEVAPEVRAAAFAAALRAEYQALVGDPAIGPSLLEVITETAERWYRARDTVQRFGALVDGALGALKPNPAVSQAAKASDQLAALLSQCGLTPAGFGRLGLKPVERDEFDAYLAGASEFP